MNDREENKEPMRANHAGKDVWIIPHGPAIFFSSKEQAKAYQVSREATPFGMLRKPNPDCRLLIYRGVEIQIVEVTGFPTGPESRFYARLGKDTSERFRLRPALAVDEAKRLIDASILRRRL
jgi:hypothetical protein